MANKDFQVKNGLVVNGGKVAINTESANVSLHINASDGIQLPVGNNNQRPANSDGLLRFNSELEKVEWQFSNVWSSPVLESIRVLAGGIATGGGPLSANVTITVPIANQAQSEAGSNNSVAMTPLRVAQAISALAASGGNVVVQVFTSSGTYTPTQGLKSSLVIATGGGGSGGSASTADAGGGGGGGGTSIDLLTANDIGASQSITIGSGGAKRTQSHENGLTGGTTLFGSILTANGGLGGSKRGGSNEPAEGGLGGSASGGRLNLNGSGGYLGWNVNTAINGFGGPSFWGNGFGAGGAGGEAGKDGVVFILEFIL